MFGRCDYVVQDQNIDEINFYSFASLIRSKNLSWSEPRRWSRPKASWGRTGQWLHRHSYDRRRHIAGACADCCKWIYLRCLESFNSVLLARLGTIPSLI